MATSNTEGLVKTETDYHEQVKKPGFLLVEVFSKFAGPCDAIQNTIKKWKTEYGADMRYVQALADDVNSLEKFRNKSIPTFLIMISGGLIEVVKGVNTPYLEKAIKAQIEGFKSGTAPEVIQSPPQSPILPGADDSAAGDYIPSPPEGKEYTFAVIKPDAVQSYHEIKEQIMSNGFEIVKEKKFLFKKSQACEFYKEHVGKAFFSNLIQYMTSGPIIGLILSKKDAVNSWRILLGPTNARRAKEEVPNSLRAKYGNDGLRNALHGSDSADNAQREYLLVFRNDVKGLQEVFSKRSGEQPHLETSFIILRPEIVGQSALPILQIAAATNTAPSRRGSASGRRESVTANRSTSQLPEPQAFNTEETVLESILYQVLLSGLSLVNAEELVLTKEQVEAVVGPVSDSDYTNWSSGMSVVLGISGDHAVAELKNLVGPAKVSEAKASAPESLVARFGLSDDKPGFWVATNVDIARKTYELFFPHAVKKGISQANVMETTFTMLKPDIVGSPKQEQLLQKITDAGFLVKGTKELRLTPEMVASLYSEHKDKPFYPELLAYMTQGPVVSVLLEKINAVVDYRNLMGPSDVEKAKESHPDSLRAIFGTDRKANAIYGSDSLLKAQRDIDQFFHFKTPGRSQTPDGSPQKPATPPYQQPPLATAPEPSPLKKVISNSALKSQTLKGSSSNLTAISGSKTDLTKKPVTGSQSLANSSAKKVGSSSNLKPAGSISGLKKDVTGSKSALPKADAPAQGTAPLTKAPSSTLKKTPSGTVKASTQSLSKPKPAGTAKASTSSLTKAPSGTVKAALTKAPSGTVKASTSALSKAPAGKVSTTSLSKAPKAAEK